MAEKEEVIDFSKLSLEERAGHKNFKARISAYEDLIKIFSRLYDEKAPEWTKYISIIKGTPLDGHASSQEKGLEASLLFLENSSQGTRIVGDMVSGVIAKCLTSTRARVKELGCSIVMMCVEIEKYEIVQEEMMKGMDLKNPKVVAACITLFTQVIREFGARIFKAKLIAKKLITLLEDRDKTIRDESKKMAIALWHWIGPAFGKDMSSLKPALLTELEGEYAKVSSTKPQQTRYLRSEQAKKDRPEAEEEAEQELADSVEENAPEVDPYDLLLPEDILSKLPKDFYEKLEAKKWQERKEALEALEALLVKYLKLDAGDYADLVRALKRIITKDSNVVVVALAVKGITGLATGLKKKFSPYAASVMGSLLEKFKEKKAVVLNPLKEATDAVYLCTTLESIAEDAISTLQNKNPAMKVEVGLFLVRAFSKTPNKVFQDKKFMKQFITALLTNLNESDLAVRDAAAEALGVIYKAMGERGIAPFLTEIEPLKLAKIKESAEKAVVLAPAKADVVKPKPKPKESAPSKPTSAPVAKKAPTIKKPAASTKKVVKPEADANSNYNYGNQLSTAEEPAAPVSQPVNPNARVDLTTKLGEGLMEKLMDKNWKTREDALEKLAMILSNNPKIQAYLGDLVSVINARLADSNRGLAATAFVVLQNLAGCLGPHCKQHLRQFLPSILGQLGDNRLPVRSNAIACLNAWAENTSVEDFFQGEMITEALKQPSPLARSELYNWLATRMPGMKNVNKDDLASALPVLFSNVEDRSVDVRKSANDCVLGFMIHLGYEKMSSQAARLKPASKAAVMAALEKTRPYLPAGTPVPQKGKPVVGGGSGKGKPNTSGQGLPGSSRQSMSPGTTFTQSPAESGTPVHRNLPNLSDTPSPNYGSAETLVISPPPLGTIESENPEIVSAEVPISNARDENDDWNGSRVPKEFQVDFENIRRKYSKYDTPMPPLVLLETDTDFIEEPIRLPNLKSRSGLRSASAGNEVLPSRASQSIDLVIVQITNSDLKKSIEALIQMDTVVTDTTVSSFMTSRVDQLMVCITMQLRKILPIFETDDGKKKMEAEQIVKCIAQVVQSTYRHPDLPGKVSMETVKDLVYACLLFLVHPVVLQTKSMENVLRYYNIMVVRIIERSDLNCAICACMRLMTDSLNLPHFNRIMDLAMKCQWKALKQLSTYVDEKVAYEYDIGAIITEFHIFLRTHPFQTWRERDQTPLKTMKTVVHNLVTKFDSARILAVLQERPVLMDSEAGSYMRKLIEREETRPSEDEGQAPTLQAVPPPTPA